MPSRFVGTETVLNPANFSTTLPSVGRMTEVQLNSFYHPPFNRVSNYRDPGRVNINTIRGAEHRLSPSDLDGDSEQWT